MMTIDGSQGEGGGQVLRTSLSLAALTGKPIRIHNIRAGRRNPGLAPQHLTAVRAVASLCQARVIGDELGSQDITFEPNQEVRAGEYRFDVAEVAQGGSAGSVTLLAQALLPPLAMAGMTSNLNLLGGTHVRWSPSFHYLKHVYLPIWQKLGVESEVELKSWGFYPAGGGQLELTIMPSPEALAGPLDLSQRGQLTGISGVAVASNLPAHIAQRMTNRARNLLAHLEADFSVAPKRVTGSGPGAGIFLTAAYERLAAGFTGHGEPGKPAQQVAEEACQSLLKHHDSTAAVDHHLADQILLPLALTDGVSEFSISQLSSHFQTNAALIERLLPAVEIRLQSAGDTVQVSVAGVKVSSQNS